MGLFATIRHIKRLSDLEERMRTLESAHRALDLEWSDTHEDLRKMLGKISKRAKQLERLEPLGDSGAPARPGSDAGDSSMGLTEGQARAQREILARRRALGN